MTAQARKILYVNRPLLLNERPAFNQYCPNAQEQTIVLGCYHPRQDGIYVFAVNDPQLQGVEQVTAAHEMLHAAYDRLSAAERQQVDGWLEDYYAHDLHDQRLLGVMDAYKKIEPNDVVNEMHSIFGTEVATLPAPLEHYYARYFSKRAAIVAFAASYQQVFTSRTDLVHYYDAELATLKVEITADESELQQSQVALKEQLQTLHDARSGGNIAEYNAGVSSYNQKVAAYNALVVATKTTIDQYNQLVAQRNAIALETQKLQNELTGTLTPLAQQ